MDSATFAQLSNLPPDLEVFLWNEVTEEISGVTTLAEVLADQRGAHRD